MIFSEKRFNLFNVDDKYFFAHCISADANTDNRAMGLGIVVDFNKKFHVKNKIKQYEKLNIGDVILIDRVFNLITKSKYFGKPTYQTLTKTLLELKSQIIKKDIKYLAMPKIGCGLDKLQWCAVRELIQDIFEDVDIEILICYK